MDDAWERLAKGLIEGNGESFEVDLLELDLSEFLVTALKEKGCEVERDKYRTKLRVHRPQDQS